jgi:hypothetical protein
MLEEHRIDVMKREGELDTVRKEDDLIQAQMD